MVVTGNQSLYDNIKFRQHNSYSDFLSEKESESDEEVGKKKEKKKPPAECIVERKKPFLFFLYASWIRLIIN